MSETVMLMILLLSTALVAFVTAWFAGKKLIPFLHQLKFGQMIREVGPAWHKNKQGTPTMGGIIFVIGFVVALAAAFIVCELWFPTGVTPVERVRLLSGLALSLGCGLIGFADDYIKVVKKRNLGLTSSQKMLLQLIVSTSYAVMMFFFGEASVIHIPFFGMVDIGWWFLPLCIFFVVGFSNATNLTDGIDGLCGSITVVASCCFAIAATKTAHYSQSVIVIAFAGAMLGFLMWNLHPAKVFMGDTGSLLIGGLLCAVAFGIGYPLLLLPIGIMYIVETLSVMLQVSYFKLTHGKRLFKMSPIHHHFEMCGWSENKIVAVFSTITAIGGVIALMLI